MPKQLDTERELQAYRQVGRAIAAHLAGRTVKTVSLGREGDSKLKVEISDPTPGRDDNEEQVRIGVCAFFTSGSSRSSITPFPVGNRSSGFRRAITRSSSIGRTRTPTRGSRARFLPAEQNDNRSSGIRFTQQHNACCRRVIVVLARRPWAHLPSRRARL